MASLKLLLALFVVFVAVAAVPKRAKRGLPIGKAFLPEEVQHFLKELSPEEKKIIKELKEELKETLKSGKPVTLPEIEQLIKKKSPALNEKLQKLKSVIDGKIATLPDGAQKFFKEVKMNVANVLASGQALDKDHIKERIGKLIGAFNALSAEDKAAIFKAFPNLKKLSEEPKFKALLENPGAADVTEADLEVN
uniref:Fatty-acid and retinol-binding protein 1 n=1 Tax=Steinernema glaseri TaxID=37863 RepID=A0A1I7Z7V6_9BILA